MHIAIQGTRGSFHDTAAHRFFGENIQVIPCESFTKVFAAVENSDVDAGVVAIENSLYGSLHETYDLLMQHHTPIIGEISLHIHQHLIALPGTKPENITEIISQSPALDQCRNYLETHFPDAELVEYHDTAAAVDYVKQQQLMHAAAIASEAAAALYGMHIIERNIEDQAENITRFVVIQKQAAAPLVTATKASLILVTSHQPGALYDALGVFKTRGANLTKIESRPVRSRAFKYQFIVDVLTSAETLAHISDELRKQDCQVTILGHYLAS